MRKDSAPEIVVDPTPGVPAGPPPPLGWWVIASPVAASRAAPLPRSVLHALRPRFSLLARRAHRRRSG